MIFDFHATFGNVARHGRDWRLDDLAAWADRCGIDALVVESADARVHFDDDPHERLLAACRKRSDRFLPAATISLASDEHSLRVARSARRRGFACVVLRERIFEESRVLSEVLAELERAPLPVYRPTEADEFDLVCKVARSHSDLVFVLAPSDFRALELNHRVIDLPNVYLSIARTLFSIGQIEKAVRRMGADRILFAGDMPHQHPGRPLGVILDAEIEEADRVKIRGESARKLLAAHDIPLPPDVATRPPPRPPCRFIDIHGHIGCDPRRPDYDMSAEAVLRYQERAGGEVIHISSIEAMSGDVVAGNDMVIEACRRHPGRLRGYLVINPWRGEACLEDMRHCRERGFIGFKPYPDFMGHRLADPVMEPVLGLAEELGLPMLCHSSADDLARVLKRRPNFKMLAAHMTFEYEAKARLARDYPNTYIEISGAGSGLEDIMSAVLIAGPEKLVFGSDNNSCPPGFTLYPLLCSGLPDGILRQILRENALRIFGDG